MVAVSVGVDPGIWRRLDRPFLHRKKQARHFSASTLVIHGRLQNDLDDVDGTNLRRGQKGACFEKLKDQAFHEIHELKTSITLLLLPLQYRMFIHIRSFLINL